MIDDKAKLDRAILLKKKLDTWYLAYAKNPAAFHGTKPPVLAILEKQWQRLHPNLRLTVAAQLEIPLPPLGESA